MPKKPTVAFVHYSCPPVIGGVEVVIEAHAKLFAEAGYPVRMIVGKGGKPHPKAKLIEIPEIMIGGGPFKKEMASLAKERVPKNFDSCVDKAEKKLAVALKGVDVCFMHNVLTMHFNLILTAALARIMAKKGKTHFVSWTHDLSFADPRYARYCKKSYPWNLMGTKLEGCDYCVISKQRQAFTSKIMKLDKAEIPIVPDGISTPDFLDMTDRVKGIFSEERLYEMDIVLVTPARIVPRKRLEFGVEIIAALKRQGKKVRWLVTGAPDACNVDSYQEEVMALVKRLKVEKEIIFVGSENGKPVWVSDEDVHSLYNVSDVLIFASQQEGFGIPVLEGGLAKNLLVLSRIPVLREIAGPESGCDVVWVPAATGKKRHGLETLGKKKADAIARQIIRKLNKSPQYLFRKNVIDRYSWDMVFQHHMIPIVLKPKKFWS